MPQSDTTPPPAYAPNVYTEANQPARRMDGFDKARYRAAAARARTVYPGAVGELLARELMVVDEFGWALGAECLLTRVLRDVESRPVKPHISAQSVARGDVPKP